MAPLRRYLRITKYSVLECRIYLDNPSLVHSWLLHPRDPVLPRVLESVRPLVLPKLVEERERARKKGAKNKGAIKDVLVEEDFEVSLFLTETDTRHSLLFKHRKARDKTQTRLVSNSTKLTGASRESPINVDDGGASGGQLLVEIGGDGKDSDEGDIVITAATAGAEAPSTLRREDSEEAPAAILQTIPDVHAEGEGGRTTRSKRQAVVQVEDSEDDEEDDDNESLFGSDDGRPAKRLRTDADKNEDEDEGSKKKIAMDVVYEGFAIYGRVLCLVVKKRSPAASNDIAAALQTKSRSSSAKTKTSATRPAGHAAMENWIASTQAPPEVMEAADVDVP